MIIQLYKNFGLLFSLLIWFNITKAQDSYIATILKVKDGLPSNVVNILIFNQEQQLLIGTQRGLVVYDGYRFIAIDKANRNIESIAAFNSKIYFHQMGSGIGEYQNNFKPISYIKAPLYTDNNPNNDHFNHLFIESTGKIWCNDYQYLKSFDSVGTPFDTIQLHNHPNAVIKYFSLFTLSPNKKILFSDKGIWLVERNNLSQLIFESTITASQVLTNDEILFTTENQEIWIFNLSTLQARLLNRLPEPIKKISHHHDEIFLLGYKSLYSFSVKQKVAKQIYHYDHQLNDFVIDSLSNILWLASNDGLIELKPKQRIFETIRLPNNTDDYVIDVKNLDNNIFVLTKNHFYHFQKNALLNTLTIPNKNAQHILLDKDSIYIITENTIYKYYNEQLKAIRINIPPKIKIKKAIITTKNVLWLMQESDTPFLLDWKSHMAIERTINNTEEFWHKNQWNDIKEIDQKIWMVGWMPQSFGITYFDEASYSFKDLAAERINDNSMFVGDYYHFINSTIHQQILVSAYGGWNELLNNGKITKRIDIIQYPIHSDIVKGIASNNNNEIFFGTSEGLYIYQSKSDAVYAFTEKEGLPENNITHAFHLLNDTTLLLGIRAGWTQVNLKALTATKLLNRLNYTRVLLDSIPQDHNEPIRFGPKNNTLVILLSALTYNQQNQITYRYKFDTDTSWIYLNNNPEIILSHLPEGKYNLLIEAGDHMGNWSQKQLALAIVAIPVFYKSRIFFWFIIIVIVLLAVLTTKFLLIKARKEAQLHQQVIQNEMRALKAQMNPHFIFNSLNAIQSFIIQEKSEEASSYLSAFSKLLRYILEYSREELISLHSEIKALQIYLQLESARLENKFSYDFYIDDTVDQNTTMIPPLIIQPFVENAIWHGIRNINYPGKIWITVQYIPDGLQIIIGDNGIGRTIAHDATANNYKRKHFGVAIANERIKLFNPRNQIIIEDYSSTAPCGTLVTINLYH